jgi:hypothetical protein
MLIIPERRAVVITPPRTGSTALRKAVLAAYPRAFSPYRHMEATGIPYGYERWARYGIIRHPIERLWSLFKFMQVTNSGTEEWRARQREESARDFEQWLMNPWFCFCDSGVRGEWGSDFDATYAIHNAIPDQPVTGAEIIRMEDNLIEDILEVRLTVENGTRLAPIPSISGTGQAVLRQRFGWDFSFYDDFSFHAGRT